MAEHWSSEPKVSGSSPDGITPLLSCFCPFFAVDFVAGNFHFALRSFRNGCNSCRAISILAQSRHLNPDRVRIGLKSRLTVSVSTDYFKTPRARGSPPAVMLKKVSSIRASPDATKD